MPKICSCCGKEHTSRYRLLCRKCYQRQKKQKERSQKGLGYTPPDALPGEEWKDVVGWEGLYQVSNLGRVRSVPRNGTTLEGRIMKGHLLKSGYWQVELSKGSKGHGFRVHRLVAEAFVPNVESKEFVNHIDGDKQNNRVENLEWVTRSENQLHAIYVVKTQKTRAVEQLTEEGKIVRKWDSILAAARALDINPASITMVCRGRRKNVGGFYWRYT